jgi:WD40 repeat protein
MQQLTCLSTGQSIRLVKTIASSGEGVVWETSQPGIIAKVYHQPTKERIRKLQVMIAHPPQNPMAHHHHLTFAWPQDILQDQRGSALGFTMPMIDDSLKLSMIYNPRLRNRKAPRFNWKYLHTTARNIALAIHSLHTEGYVIGDIKPQNMLVNQSALISIIDTDSFQVRNPSTGESYRCLVGSEGFTPPELLGKDLATIDQTEIHDRFRLGVMIYLLLFGDHPFKGKWSGAGESPQPSDLVRQGHWPFAPGSLIKPGPTTIPLSVVHLALQTCFQNCFTQGYHNPQLRPSAMDWAKALGQAVAELTTCNLEPNHLYARHYGRCYWCERKSALKVDIFNPTIRKVAPKPPTPKRQPTVSVGLGSPLPKRHRPHTHPSHLGHRGSQRSRTYVQPPPISSVFHWMGVSPMHRTSGPFGKSWTRLPPSVVGGTLCLVSLLGLALLLLPDINLDGLDQLEDQFQRIFQSGDPASQRQPPPANAGNSREILGIATPGSSKSLAAHGGSVTDLSISADGNRLLSASEDGSLRLWDLASGKLIRNFDGVQEPVYFARFIRQGTGILSSGNSGTVMEWDVQSGGLKRTFKNPPEFGTIESSQLLADASGQLFINNDLDGKIYIRNLVAQTTQRIETGTLSSEQALLLMPDRKGVLSSTADGQLMMWDARSGKIIGRFPGPESWQSLEPIRLLAADRQGQWLVSGNWSGTVSVWNLAQGSVVRTIVGHKKAISAIDLNATADYVASGSSDRLIKVWNLKTGKLIRVLKGHQAEVTTLEFSPTQSWLISGSRDRTIRVWDVKTGALVKIMGQ